ncbi:hypothetical protein OG21DRAFT_1510489 [Imleria badia]|nr:hypothetical protein OG21DRAFT_1510489 [Imleria badia]
MSSTEPRIPLGPTYGAELLATFACVALWGTTCMQTLIYFIQYPNERLLLKSLVMWLWLANTAHEILIVKGVYDSQIVHFCDYNRIQTVVPEFIWQVLLTSLVAVSSQIFFTSRLWRFGGERWFYFAILVPVCSFELVGALVFIWFGTIIPTAAELVSPVLAGIFTAIQAVAAGADLAIAAGLIIMLFRRRGQALRRTRSTLQKLLVLTVNTGIWTALFAVFTFISMLAFKNTLIYAALYFPLCPLYCNTVLANLNAREYLLTDSNASEGGTADGTYDIGLVFASNTVGTQSTDPAISAQVGVKKSVRHDDDESALRARGNMLDLENQ